MQTYLLQRLVPSLLTAFGAVALSLAVVAGCTSPGRLDTSGMSFASEPLVGKVVWNDLITEDIEAARRFYGELFDWTFEDSVAPGRQGYAVARSGKVYVAGLVPVAPRSDGTKLSRWLPYISVDDVDSAVARATAAGAQVAVGARDLGFGRVAAIIDPSGAIFVLQKLSR
jgi:uncharacterized protein